MRTGPLAFVFLALAACRGDNLDPDTDDPWDPDDSGGTDTASWGEDSGDVDVLPSNEEEARDLLMRTGIDLIGQALTPEGVPIVGATVTAGTAVTTTDAEGWFRFDDLRRHNLLVHIEATGWRSHRIPAWLLRPIDVDLVTLDAVALQPEDPNVVRFLFAGDMAFGRRYLDPDESTPWNQVPPSDPTALINTADPLPGTRAVLEAISPYFLDADYPIVNLESVVTDRPLTPHPTKDFVYFTMPGSLPALTELGVQYVGLGNNHTYDYLEGGIGDTLAHVEAAGLEHSGLGYTPEEAWEPYRVDLAGAPYSMISACSIDGSQHDIGYVATDTQGGAANLRDTDMLREVFGGETAEGRIPIAMLHTGVEYTYEASSYSRGRFDEVAAQGAALVVSHHPHVAQGFGKYGDTWAAHCLGNAAFDQERLETMTGLLVQADMDADEVRDLEGIPIQIERYRSRPVTGELAATTLRRIAEFSEVPAYVWGDRIEVTTSSIPDDRTASVTVEVGSSGWAIVDLRPVQVPGESLLRAEGPVTVRPGRDLLYHGTMEDLDVDREDLEVAHWDVSSASRFPCVTGAHRGVAGICSTRGSNHTTPSVVTFRNRVRVWGDADQTPNKDVSVYGWVKGESAGPVQVVVGYLASFGDTKFGEEILYYNPGGTFDWRPFQADTHIPADVPGGNKETNPRAVRLMLYHSPPMANSGRVAWDDLAVISWEETLDLTSGHDFQTPHARDFLRVEADPGTYELDLVFRRDRRF